MSNIRLMSPGPNGQIINEYGLTEKPPADWEFLPSGDAAITRKVTALGPCWRVQVKKKRNRMQSLGVWAPKMNIAIAEKEVNAMRTHPTYALKKASAAKSRAKKQEAYTAEFEQEVKKYLNFHLIHQQLETIMACLVTAHAIPVGSGTVARTNTIPIEERASKAVIAWMRHQTTNYDNMKIARIKGERRAVRRHLAEKSIDLLKDYRSGRPIHPECPLWKAISTQSVTLSQ